MSKLEPLLADLPLPKGARLTPARRAVLARIGAKLLKRPGPIELFRARVNSVTLRWGIGRIRDRAQQAALARMAKLGWLTAVPTNTGYSRYQLVLSPPFEAIAKRLAAAGAMHAARKAERLLPLQQVATAARELAWAKSREWVNLPKTHPNATTGEILALWDEVTETSRACDAAESTLQTAEKTVVPETTPTDEEVLAWLVTRTLAKPNS